jgi:hypothetical protein
MTELNETEKKEVEETTKEMNVPEDRDGEEAKALFLEASELVLHLPNWVHRQHEIFYKVAYLQIKKDPKASIQPARIRTALIKKLMNKMVLKMGKFFEEETKKKMEEKKNESRRF